MNIDEVVKNAVTSHCEEKGYSKRLTDLMIRIVNKYRQSEVESGDLGNFLQQVHGLLEKEDS